jgi:hypothetical protein
MSCRRPLRCRSFGQLWRGGIHRREGDCEGCRVNNPSGRWCIYKMSVGEKVTRRRYLPASAMFCAPFALLALLWTLSAVHIVSPTLNSVFFFSFRILSSAFAIIQLAWALGRFLKYPHSFSFALYNLDIHCR